MQKHFLKNVGVGIGKIVEPDVYDTVLLTLKEADIKLYERAEADLGVTELHQFVLSSPDMGSLDFIFCITMLTAIS